MKRVISLVLVLVVVLTAFAACTPVEEKILGSWKGPIEIVLGNSQEGTYVFNEGGTGKVQFLDNAGGLDMKWSIYENQLTIEYDSSAGGSLLQSLFNLGADIISDPISYTFEIKSDELILTKADGTKTIYTRVVTE